MHTRSDSRLFNMARLRAKIEAIIRDVLIADDAAVFLHNKKITTVPRGQIHPSLQELWSNYQLEEGENVGPGCGHNTCHHH